MSNPGHFPPDTSELAAKVATLETSVAVLQTQTEQLSKMAVSNGERYHTLTNMITTLTLRVELLAVQPKCPDPAACVRVGKECEVLTKAQSEVLKRIEALEQLRSRFYGALWAFGVAGTVIGALLAVVAKHLWP